MGSLFFVMAGGALGAGARHLLGRLMLSLLGPGYPWGTLTANLAGGMLMGLLVGSLARMSVPGEGWRLFLGVGVLGGFTTFSSFALENVLMIERGDWAMAAGYALASLAGSIMAVFAGLWIVRGLA